MWYKDVSICTTYQNLDLSHNLSGKAAEGLSLQNEEVNFKNQDVILETRDPIKERDEGRSQDGSSTPGISVV